MKLSIQVQETKIKQGSTSLSGHGVQLTVQGPAQGLSVH